MSGWLKHREDAGKVIITAGGDWDVRQSVALDAELQTIPHKPGAEVTIDLREITRLDTAGAWLLHRTIKNYKQSGSQVDLQNLRAVSYTHLTLPTNYPL